MLSTLSLSYRSYNIQHYGNAVSVIVTVYVVVIYICVVDDVVVYDIVIVCVGSIDVAIDAGVAAGVVVVVVDIVGVRCSCCY